MSLSFDPTAKLISKKSQLKFGSISIRERTEDSQTLL